jgi:hypothetical protein
MILSGHEPTWPRQPSLPERPVPGGRSLLIHVPYEHSSSEAFRCGIPRAESGLDRYRSPSMRARVIGLRPSLLCAPRLGDWGHVDPEVRHDVPGDQVRMAFSDKPER